MSTAARTRMSRPARAKQLLDVAEQVFAERGIGAASMEEIAERAGVTKPILYDHYGSKEGLVAAVVRRSADQLAARLTDAAAGAGDAEHALRAGLEAYFVFADEHAPAWSALLAETGGAAGIAAHELETMRRDIAALISSMIAAALPAVGTRRAATYADAIVGACERLAVARLTGPRQSSRRLAEAMMELVWSGLASKSTS